MEKLLQKHSESYLN